MAKSKRKPVKLVRTRRGALKAIVEPNWKGGGSIRAPQATLKPAEIMVGKRFRKDFGDLKELAASIDARGLIQPIVVKPDKTLIAGERRLKAWPLTKFRDLPIPVYVLDVDSIVAGERDENAVRKDFTPSEAVAIKRAMADAEAKAARDRMAAAKRKGGKVDEKDKGRAADKIAAVTGRARRTLDKAEAIVAAAEANPRKFGALQEAMDRTGRVDAPYKRLVNLQQADKLRKEPPPWPGRGPYRVGVVDLPWPSEPGDDKPAKRGRGYYPYPTMSIADMKALAPRVKRLFHTDAWLWFWIPNFHAAKGIHAEILCEWGFEPVLIRTWRKNKIGNGQLLRGQSEPCIIAKRGKPLAFTLKNETTIFDGKVGKHSEKPQNFYEDVERLCPASRYVSLFAGGKRPGPKWDCHGDRVAAFGASIGEEIKGVKVDGSFASGLGKNSLDVIAAKIAAGEITWRPDGRDFRAAVWRVGDKFFDGGDGKRGRPNFTDRPRGFAGGLEFIRRGRSVSIADYVSDSGCGFGAGCVGATKVASMISAWKKVATLPAEAMP